MDLKNSLILGLAYNKSINVNYKKMKKKLK
jgi:hypothetical protein